MLRLFSKMGEDAAKGGDLEGARFYGKQMDSVLSGSPISVECKPPKQLASTMDMKKASELNKKLTREAKLYQQIMPKMERLQGIETKLEEVKNKRGEAEKKIKELNSQIDEIKAKTQTAETPEKRSEADDLLAQAMALKADAEKQQSEAIQSEEKLLKEKQGLENELNTVKDKMQAGWQK